MYRTYIKLENLLVKAANKEDFEDELKFVIDFYKDDLNRVINSGNGDVSQSTH